MRIPGRGYARAGTELTVTLLRAALPVTCPSCGAKISWRDASTHAQFICPECAHGVHVRKGYFRALNVTSLVVTAFVAYGAGARGNVLFWSVILGWIPVSFLVTFFTMRIFPPDTESTGDYRGILYRPSDGPSHSDNKANDAREER